MSHHSSWAPASWTKWVQCVYEVLPFTVPEMWLQQNARIRVVVDALHVKNANSHWNSVLYWDSRVMLSLVYADLLTLISLVLYTYFVC